MRAILLAMACSLDVALTGQSCLRPVPPPGGLPVVVDLVVPVTYSDGYQTEGSLIRPDGAPPTCGWPLVVYVHVLGQARSFELALQTTIAGQGYAVWSYDVRGHGSGQALNPTHPHAGSTLWGPVERHDLAEQILFVSAHPAFSGIIDPSRTAVVGSSQGGAHAWFAAAHSGQQVTAPSRPPVVFPPVRCVIATDLVPEATEDWLRGGGLFSSWFVELIAGTYTGVPFDQAFILACRNAFITQDPSALASLFTAEGRNFGGLLATSPVPVLHSHAYFDNVASPLSAVRVAEQRTATHRTVLSTIGHAVPSNAAERAQRDALMLQWLHRYLWDDPNEVDVETAPLLAELPLSASERADPLHLWSHVEPAALTTPAASPRWFLHDDAALRSVAPAGPQVDATIHQVIDPLATGFTPNDYLNVPATRDPSNVLLACPLQERSYSLTAVEATQLVRSATVHLRVVPDQPRWLLAALLTVQPAGPGAEEVMLASGALVGSTSVQGVAEDHDLRLPPVAVRIPAGATIRLRLRNLWLRESPMFSSLEVAPLFQDFRVDIVHGDAPAGSWLELPLEPVRPRLVVDQQTLQLSAPAAVGLTIRGGPGRAGYPYFATVGLSGRGPSSPYLNDVVPVEGDWLVLASVASTTPPFSAFLGFLGPTGEAACALDLTSVGPLPQFLNGMRFTFAAFVWDGPWASTGAATNACDVVLR